MLSLTRKGVAKWEHNKGKFQYTSKTGARYEVSQEGIDKVFRVYRKDKLLREYRYTGDEKKNHTVFGLYNYLCKKHGKRPEDTKGNKKPKPKK